MLWNHQQRSKLNFLACFGQIMTKYDFPQPLLMIYSIKTTFFIVSMHLIILFRPLMIFLKFVTKSITRYMKMKPAIKSMHPSSIRISCLKRSQCPNFGLVRRKRFCLLLVEPGIYSQISCYLVLLCLTFQIQSKTFIDLHLQIEYCMIPGYSDYDNLL